MKADKGYLSKKLEKEETESYNKSKENCGKSHSAEKNFQIK